jgi:CrcB protein
VRSLAFVAAGGVVGVVARWWLGGALQRLGGAEFPVGTLGVNVLGSFVLGLVMVLSLERGLLGADLRVLLAIGLCGGFTTMSTFSWETLALLQAGEPGLALANVGLTLAACLAAVWAGQILARAL